MSIDRPISARLLQSMRKMTAGTFAGQSRVATPCDCKEQLAPSGPRGHTPRLFVFSQNAVWGHPLHKVPVSFTLGPFTPVPGGNGNLLAGSQYVYSVTGARLADGRGLLLWMRGSDNHRTDATGAYLEGAYTNSVYDFLKNDVIAPGDIVTWDSGNWYYKGAVRVWTDPFGDVFYTLLYLYDTAVGSGQRGFVKIYKANDPADPLAGFSLYSTIQSNAIPGIGGTSYWEVEVYPVTGKPYFVSPTRWVYVGGQWGTAFGQFFCQASYWYSDNAGVTWTFVMENSNGTYTNYLPGQIARSPTNGYLYSQDSFSSVSQNGDIWESQDDGVSWTSVHSYGGIDNTTPFWCFYEDPFKLDSIYALNVKDGGDVGDNRWIYLATDDYIASTIPWPDSEFIPYVNFGQSATIWRTAKTEIFEVQT